MIIGILYKVLLLFTLINSLPLSRKYIFSAQNCLVIYLLMTTLNEWISFIRNLINPTTKVGLQYNLYFILCIFIFFFFYKKVLKTKLKNILIIIFSLLIFYTFFLTHFTNEDFDKKIGIAISFFYIIISLLWFYQKISFFDENKITDDPVFWISTAILMWSCFFIFRVIPMFYFAKEDEDFLDFLKIGQNVINIVMYIMFYVSIKKYKALSYEPY